MIDDRIERLLAKAEQSIDDGDLDQASSYRYLAHQVAALRRKEARELNRAVFGQVHHE